MAKNPAPSAPRAARKRVRPRAPAVPAPHDEPAPLDAILDELGDRVEAMSDRMLARYQASIPSYRSMPEQTLQQVRQINVTNLTGFIEAMREHRGPGEAELSLIRDSAIKRVREGIPLSALLAAYRLGAQLAWAEAREIAGRGDPERLSAALDLATAVMAWVDEVSGAVAQSYLEEYERISTDREASRRDFIDALVGGELTGDEIRARADALGLDPDAPAGVAIIAIDPGDAGEVRAAQHQVRGMLDEIRSARGVPALRGNEIVMLYHRHPDASSNDTAEALAAELRPILGRARAGTNASLHAGVGKLREPLTDLAGSYREASIALTAARAGSSAPVALYGEVVVEELILRERGVSRRLAQILDPLSDHPDLMTTLREYIEHGPALPTVARRLFLHPNTVAYRLSRIRELTGRDPKTPAGISELYLALRATQLVGD
jgi:sugar diacid utilization regulator